LGLNAPTMNPAILVFSIFFLLSVCQIVANPFGLQKAEAGQAKQPDLVVSTLNNPPAGAVIGSSFSVTDTTANTGQATAGASTTRYRLSLDNTITSGDPLLTGSRSIPSLAVGANSNGSVTATIPTNLAPNTYFLGACADDLAVVGESSETNNCRASTTTIIVSQPPAIISLNPGSGSVGTPVTISGSNFGASQGTSSVTFNGAPAAPSSWSGSSITAPVPIGATSGPVIVVVGGVASNGVTFTVEDPNALSYFYDELGRLRGVVNPQSDAASYNYDAVGNLLGISRQSSSLASVIEFTPNNGPIGTSVTIFGAGFSTTPSQNTVTFNGVTATVNSSTATQIVASVPSGASTGLISVTGPGGSAASSTPFSVTSSTGAPTVTGFTPGVGIASTPVTISGSNFETVPGNSVVSFNISRAVVTSASITTLGTTVPAKTGSGRISVATPLGKTVSTGDFFIPPQFYTPADVEFTGRMAIGAGNFGATINTASKIALVAFDATVGQQVTLNISGVTFPTRSYVGILKPDGTTLTSQVVNPGVGTSIGPVTLPASGTYSIMLATGVISTVAGTGEFSYNGDNIPATSANLDHISGVAADTPGNLYIAAYAQNRIRKVSPTGLITTVAGNGTQGYSGDGQAATKARLNGPLRVAVDGQGNLFIADTGNHRIRKVNTNGTITTVAGTGVAGFSGDGGPATSAKLNNPFGVEVDGQGNIFIADVNNRIRKVTPAGIITTVAGNGVNGYSGDGGPATSAQISGSVALDGHGNLYISGGNRVRKVDTNGIITTIAGTGTAAYNGDNIPAITANFTASGVAVDGLGNFYIGDRDNNRIRKVGTSGIITTVAGTGLGNSFNGAGFFSGDGGPGVAADISFPNHVALDGQGNLYISDDGNLRVRKLGSTSSGSMTLSLSSP
jgi:YD repeat-containing protein